MKSTLRFLIVAILLAASWSAVSAADTAQFDLLKDMSVADYRATGLDKLSDAQVKALNDWFADYQRQHQKNCAQAATAPVNAIAPVAAVSTPVSAAPVSRPVSASSDTIISRLSGTFTGWSGNTLFKLDNGQTWEQSDDEVLSIAAIQHPQVTISKGAFNAYYLSVKGMLDSVQVRRVQP